MTWFILYGSVVVVAAAYARLLNIKRVHDWYTPDWTFVTVIGGDGIILAGFAGAVWWYGLPWWVWWIAFFLTCAAGAPIVIWQIIRIAKRRKRATNALLRG